MKPINQEYLLTEPASPQEEELNEIPLEALKDLYKKLLQDFQFMEKRAAMAAPKALTVRQVYELFADWKYGPYAPKKLTHAAKIACHSAFLQLGKIHDRTLDGLSVMELQGVVNEVSDSGKSRTTVQRTVTLIKQLYRFAVPRELCTKEYGLYVVMPAAKEEVHHKAFSDEELAIFWKNTSDPTVRMILIMCYSGYRVVAYETMRVDLEQMCFTGGVKTASARERTVPIHSAIRPFVEMALREDRYFKKNGAARFRRDMKKTLLKLGIDRENESAAEEITHTPHSCRHTFSRLCESYGVNEADRKRMLGHSFGNDITNAVYGHRTLEELRTEIEKIRVD